MQQLASLNEDSANKVIGIIAFATVPLDDLWKTPRPTNGLIGHYCIRRRACDDLGETPCYPGAMRGKGAIAICKAKNSLLRPAWCDLHSTSMSCLEGFCRDTCGYCCHYDSLGDDKYRSPGRLYSVVFAVKLQLKYRVNILSCTFAIIKQHETTTDSHLSVCHLKRVSSVHEWPT